MPRLAPIRRNWAVHWRRRDASHHSSAVALITAELGAPRRRPALSSAPCCPPEIVIVGAGQAAAAAIDTLRRKGLRGRHRIRRRGRSWPYQRPPLSKKYLAGALAQSACLMRPRPVLCGAHHRDAPRAARCRASSAPRSAFASMMARRLRMTSCCLQPAAGRARSRRPGARLRGVHYLRTLTDVAAIRSRTCPGPARRHHRRRLHWSRGGRHLPRAWSSHDGARDGRPDHEPRHVRRNIRVRAGRARAPRGRHRVQQARSSASRAMPPAAACAP